MQINPFKKIIIITFSTILSLVAAEIVLRFSGYEAWKNITLNENEIYVPDATLGWISKKGSYIIKQNNKLSKEFIINIGDNGERLIDNKNNYNNEILIIGGSFAQGWGVNDNETFSYKLQKEFNKFKIYNFGQGAYGSVQSLLMLKKQISKMKSPKLVIYGLIAHHEYRNVARARWLRTLSKYSERGHVSTPYALLEKNNNLILHGPTSYFTLPFREISVLVTLLEEVFMKLKTKKRKKQQLIVTKEIILKMKNISNQFNSDFILVILDLNNPDKKEGYKDYFKKNKIKYVDCSVLLVDEMVLPGDYHPSEKAHSYYKKCLSDYIYKKGVLIN